MRQRLIQNLFIKHRAGIHLRKWIAFFCIISSFFGCSKTQFTSNESKGGAPPIAVPEPKANDRPELQPVNPTPPPPDPEPFAFLIPVDLDSIFPSGPGATFATPSVEQGFSSEGRMASVVDQQRGGSVSFEDEKAIFAIQSEEEGFPGSGNPTSVVGRLRNRNPVSVASQTAVLIVPSEKGEGFSNGKKRTFSMSHRDSVSVGDDRAAVFAAQSPREEGISGESREVFAMGQLDGEGSVFVNDQGATFAASSVEEGGDFGERREVFATGQLKGKGVQEIALAVPSTGGEDISGAERRVSAMGQVGGGASVSFGGQAVALAVSSTGGEDISGVERKVTAIDHGDSVSFGGQDATFAASVDVEGEFSGERREIFATSQLTEEASAFFEGQKVVLAVQMTDSPFFDEDIVPFIRDDSALGTIFFDVDSADLSDKALDILDENIRWLEYYPYVHVVLEGHCDPQGSEKYNIALGQSRAEQVRQYLLDQGITEERIEVISYGESNLLSYTDNAQNRRVSFLIDSETQ